MKTRTVLQTTLVPAHELAGCAIAELEQTRKEGKISFVHVFFECNDVTGGHLRLLLQPGSTECNISVIREICDRYNGLDCSPVSVCPGLCSFSASSTLPALEDVSRNIDDLLTEHAALDSKPRAFLLQGIWAIIHTGLDAPELQIGFVPAIAEYRQLVFARQLAGKRESSLLLNLGGTDIRVSSQSTIDELLAQTPSRESSKVQHVTQQLEAALKLLEGWASNKPLPEGFRLSSNSLIIQLGSFTVRVSLASPEDELEY